MYTTRNRTSARKSYHGVGVRSGTPTNIGFSSPALLEGIYSWRTGSSNIADPAGSPPLRQKRQDGWGLIAPSNQGSLGDRIAERKRYLEDFQRMAVPAQTDAGANSTSKVSTTDTGHPFATYKVLRVRAGGTMDYYQNASNWYDGDVWSSSNSSSGINVTPYSFGFYNEGTVSPLVVSPANRQATANRYFAATAPDRKGASIGLTLIELLRGDVPSLLKNFREMMAGLKTVRNYVGSEGLNIMFGWTPLIQEYANLITTGMALERVIYYESFRRKRRWDGPSFSSAAPGTTVISQLTGPWGLNATYPLAGETIGSSGGFGMQYATQNRTSAVEDYHLSSKYVGLAKAGRRAESFSDQAMDVAKRMGLVDDPRLLWDLTPYSWLVDWFTTMGDSISNAQVYAPLTGKYTSDYAYMTTKHTVIDAQEVIRPTSAPSQYLRRISLTSPRNETISVSKWRARATPFGFGSQLGSLNASQFAVLVALGFAKTR